MRPMETWYHSGFAFCAAVTHPQTLLDTAHWLLSLLTCIFLFTVSKGKERVWVTAAARHTLAKFCRRENRSRGPFHIFSRFM